MNRILTLTFIIFSCLICNSQKLNLKISGNSVSENKIIDSISYTSNHINAKSITDETNLFSEKLNKIGFIENEILDFKKTNDSTFFAKYKLNKKFEFIHIYISENSQLKSALIFKSKNDTITIPYTEIETFLKESLSKLEKSGFALAKLKLVDIEKRKNYLTAKLDLIFDNKRFLNGIVINGYDKFPKGHYSNLKKLYQNKIFNQETVKQIYSDINKYRFIKQVKYPEILFTKDSTKIYVYLQKVKASTFDGFIGFSNNESKKIIFNGYLDLTLNNILNSGENFSVFWKSDGEKQKTFNGSVELPYIFKSRFGLKAQLNIFKQDSTFQNTKTAINLGYFFNYNSRLYLGYQATESSDIQNQNTATISDFNNSFITTQYEYLKTDSEEFIFPEKTKLVFKTGFGSRKSKFIKNNQVYFNIELKHELYLNEKNRINIKSQNFYLKSEQYIINELYRFGGINSIRGFNENSLQANQFTSILTEYRYLINPSIYIHSIIDYGYYQDQSINRKGSLIGLGIGIGLQTKNGLFNIIYANGSSNNEAIKSSNSIVHLSFKTIF